MTADAGTRRHPRAAGAAVPGEPARAGRARHHRARRRHPALARRTTCVNAMIAEGFVTHLEDEHRYGLGVAAFEVGSGYTRQAPLQRLARRPLADLVDALGESAHLAVLHGREVFYVRRGARQPHDRRWSATSAYGCRRRSPRAAGPSSPGCPRRRSGRCSPTGRRSCSGTAPARPA